jgi:hypothetical protein
VKVYFAAPISGLQHVFVTSETFIEQYDDESGEVLGYDISNPTELYAKIAEKVRRETLAEQTSQTGLPPKTAKMASVPVNPT